LQKLQLRYFSPIEDKNKLNEVQGVLLEVFFDGVFEKFEYFEQQALSAHNQVVQLRTDLLPGYVFYNDQSLTYRFTQTLFENLHWDYFPGYPDKHQVRMFANIDKEPRIWNLSHSLFSYLDQEYKNFKLEQFIGKNQHDVIIHVDSQVLKGMSGRCKDGFPRHHVAFEQGEVWIADSRKISHQIYYGNRSIIYAMEVEIGSMLDGNSRFNKQMEALHRKHARK